MKETVKQILATYNCKPGTVFSYNARSKTITYVEEDLSRKEGLLALLHEVAHASLGHFSYTYDIELLKIEVEAWEKTRELAEHYKIDINERHITDCITSYDKWISKRASCPNCGNYSLQKSHNTFGCFVCDCLWQVNERKDKRIHKKILANAKKANAHRNVITLALTSVFRLFIS